LVWARQTGLALGNTYLSEVFMVDENNVWVGGNTANLHSRSSEIYKLEYRNSAWAVTERYSFAGYLEGLFATSDADVWAVFGTRSGFEGHILHKSGDTWRELASPIPDVNWQTVSMSQDGKKGWIGGSREDPRHTRATEPILLRYEDGELSRETQMEGFWGLNSLDTGGELGWAVGGDSSWHTNGVTWSVVPLDPLPVPECGHLFYPCFNLVSVHAVSYEEAWAAGARFMGDPNSTTRRQWREQTILHRRNGRWQEVVPGQPAIGDPYAAIRVSSEFYDLSVAKDGFAVAVGGQVLSGTTDYPYPSAYVISHRSDGGWYYEQLPAKTYGTLGAVSAVDSTHILAVGGLGQVISYGYGDAESTPSPPGSVPSVSPSLPSPTSSPTLVSNPPIPLPVTTITPVPGWNPTTRVSDPHLAGVLYFPVVGHTLRGDFRAYWEQHGSLEQFGYPLTEEFHETLPSGDAFLVQYFERARLEWHKEYVPPYRVLLGLLGHEVTQGRKQEQPFKPAAPSSDRNGPYFPETQHNVLPQFADYWQAHGGLPVYGYPISEPFEEVSPTDGKPYTVQYFERNRFEYHPEKPTHFQVLLGHLGVEVVRSRGWLP
ncbi:MAG: hypothetical protein M3328_09840, partial [Chloroflexota bacterium]|nr:hypothetical protein [Chloroflexota bacterium]